MNQNLSLSFARNSQTLDRLFQGCDDIKKHTMKLGSETVDACIYYVEVAVDNMSVEESVIGKLLGRLMNLPKNEIYGFLAANALGITDVNELSTYDEVLMGVMVGDAVLIIDGYDKAIKIKSKGYPMMGVSSSEREEVMRGSREGFADALKCNTALMRKRIRSNHLKVREFIVGKESNTTVALVYLDNTVRTQVLQEITSRINRLDISNLTDSGIIEQLTEENVYSPFPQYQTTERPDTAVHAIMKGRITLFVDNTPVALLLPANFNDFLKEQLKDPEIKAEYDALEPEFAVMQAMIDARKLKGITQKELSKRTGISQGDISKLESGNGNPSIKTLQRLAKAMNMSLKIEFVSN